MTGFIEHLIEEQNQSRAYPERVYSIDDTIDVLHEVEAWLDEGGMTISLLKDLIQELITDLEKE
jgi:hypothetical protein